MAIGKEGNVKWVDGLRGIASTLVVLTHIARAFDGDLFLPTSAEGAPPRFLQWPFVRLLVQGRIGVTIFAFVTGYVCALKPIKLYAQGSQDAAFRSLAKSALRRPPRLILPATLATLLIWFFAQFGVFQVAKRSDSWWSGATSPDIVPYVGDSILNMAHNIIRTWTWGQNAYDGNQWTLLPLLKGSFQVYVFIIATAYCKPRYRMMCSLGMWLYFYVGSDSAFGMQFFFGVFLSDLQNYQPAIQFLSDRARLCRVLAVVLVALGLFVASYPEGHAEWRPWSAWLHSVLVNILPGNPDFPRFSSGIGLELIALGLHFSPFIRDVLSNRYFLWLGRQSFAVYLLHGPLLRWILVWMVYGVRIPPDVTNDKGEVEHPHIPFPGGARLLVCLPFWIPLNYGCAVLWTTYVDPWCARTTERLVAYVVEDQDEKHQQQTAATYHRRSPSRANGRQSQSGAPLLPS
ncbi:uncharacterized protein E0L32_002790 [Thyridium curvatum]|uniref:Acyltransferase 3 domain-containing protein n=1 Tax=Thyridium curvatum TaxID=1093900 RepID=A0A507BM67_9PEZI|nr:uncharacterized protein E0L32_002790 [Thyridium curvatum]TPX18281.1 hypothetical protein E0L32_002790 [Thyridium curvatum]